MVRKKGHNLSDYKFTGVERAQKSYLWKLGLRTKPSELQVWIAFRDSREIEISNSLFVRLEVSPDMAIDS